MFRDFVRELQLKPTARYVIAHCEYGYTTNLPLEVMTGEDVMLATKYEGKFLHEPELMEHGGPLRTRAQALLLEERQVPARAGVQPGR